MYNYSQTLHVGASYALNLGLFRQSLGEDSSWDAFTQLKVHLLTHTSFGHNWAHPTEALQATFSTFHKLHKLKTSCPGYAAGLNMAAKTAAYICQQLHDCQWAVNYYHWTCCLIGGSDRTLIFDGIRHETLIC